MAYKPNIPMATDAISQSQVDLQNNFGALKSLIDINHVDFANMTDQGKHYRIDFPVQSVSPTFQTGQLGLYNLNYSFSGSNEGSIVEAADEECVSFSASLHSAMANAVQAI